MPDNDPHPESATVRPHKRMAIGSDFFIVAMTLRQSLLPPPWVRYSQRVDDELNDLLAGTDPYSALERVDILIARASLENGASREATQALQAKAVLLSRTDDDEASAMLWQQVRRQWLVLDGDDSPHAAEAQRQRAMTLYWSGDPTHADEEMTAYRAKATSLWGSASDETLQAMRFTSASSLSSVGKMRQSNCSAPSWRARCKRFSERHRGDSARPGKERRRFSRIQQAHPDDAKGDGNRLYRHASCRKNAGSRRETGRRADRQNRARHPLRHGGNGMGAERGAGLADFLGPLPHVDATQKRQHTLGEQGRGAGVIASK